MIFNGEVKDQDVYMPIVGLRGHPEGLNALFSWMTENWDKIIKTHPPGSPLLSKIVAICSSGLTAPEQLEKLEAFFKDKNNNGYDQALAQAKDSIRSKISWIKRDGEDVASWIKANGYST